MAVEAAQGSRLGFVRPANTSDATVFTATMDTEVTRLFVCNNTASPVAFRIYHVPEGVAVGLDHALYYDKALAANDTFSLNSDATNSGIQLKVGDRILVRSATANALGFHVYGVTASIANMGV